MDAPQAATVSGSDMIAVLQAAGFAFATVDLINAGPLAQVSALQTIIAQLAARLTIVEAKPEEVAHFTASGKLPTAAVGASFTLVLTGIVPARAGDALKPGEQVIVWPTGTMPAGVDLMPPSVAADGTVQVPCRAMLAITASAAPIPFAVAALR